MRCSECIYYRKDGGECRRHAPQPMGHRQFAHWPKVKETDGCGEFSMIVEKLSLLERRNPALVPPPSACAAE